MPFLLGEAREEAEADGDEPRASSPAGGKILGGHRLVLRLAIGGMSEVWLADALHGPRAGQSVALKRLLGPLRVAPEAVERFREEARLQSLLDHPNIARAYGLHEADGELLLIQELVGGETLGQIAAAARKRGERISAAAALHASLGMLDALAYLHAGEPNRFPPTLHADVNPENLVASREGACKLVDFGIATPLERASAGGALRGTPAFMAPEQVKGLPLTPRSDLFSAGAVLWELLANRPLFAARTEFETLRRVREAPAPPLRAVWPEAPTALERICVRALAKDAAQRFESAAEMAEALRLAIHRSPFDGGAEALAADVQRLAPRSVRID